MNDHNENGKAGLADLLGGLLKAKAIDPTMLTADLLTNQISGIMSVMGTMGLSSERLIDALLYATATHVGAALLSFEMSGRLKEDSSIEKCIQDMANDFCKAVADAYEKTKAEVEEEMAEQNGTNKPEESAEGSRESGTSS